MRRRLELAGQIDDRAQLLRQLQLNLQSQTRDLASFDKSAVGFMQSAVEGLSTVAIRITPGLISPNEPFVDPLC